MKIRGSRDKKKPNNNVKKATTKNMLRTCGPKPKAREERRLSEEDLNKQVQRVQAQAKEKKETWGIWNLKNTSIRPKKDEAKLQLDQISWNWRGVLVKSHIGRLRQKRSNL